MQKIYTDGSCLSNPGKGGWAAFIVSKGYIKGSKELSTNNEMELTAIVQALKWCIKEGIYEVEFLTDSNYCLQGATKWLSNWIKRHWRTSSGGPVKNMNLWREYLKYSHQMNKIKFTKVAAHTGDAGNEFADKKAKEAAQCI